MSALPIFVPCLLVLIAWLWRKQRNARVGPVALYAQFIVGAVALSALTSLVWFDHNHARVFGMMALLFVAGFVAAPLYLLGVTIIDWAPRRPLARRVALVGSIVLAGVAVDALFIEPHALTTTHHEVRAVLPGERSRLRIVVLADLQTAAPGDYEREALRRAAALEPDLLLFPGDYVQSDAATYDDAAGQLRDAIRQAGFGNLPAFAVQGDVDPEIGGRSPGAIRLSWHDVFSETPVTSTSQTRRFETLGINVTALSYEDSRNTALELPRQPGFHVVFGHRPDFAMGQVDADLLIAGHTHGGQVQLPGLGPVMTLSEVPRAWADGLTRLPGAVARHLVVSRGIGMERGEAPPIRLLCTPEIVVVDVIHTGNAGDDVGVAEGP